MLKQLTIRDFALVAKVDVAFDHGLTVVTGESGAGKSILMNALALVVGERARTDLIRPGAARAEVTAEFDLAEHSASLDTLKAADLDDADAPQRCLLRRVIGVDGRSRAFVNGVPVNLGMVRELTEGLIDIHSQDENQRLARRDVQLSLLDAYGVPAADRQGMAIAYRAARKAEKALAALKAELVNAEDRRALLRYQLDELRALEPAQGEFESLEAEFRRLSQAQDIQEAVRQAIDCLSDMADARRSQRQLSGIDDEHPKLVQARDALSSALQLIDDAAHDLNGYADAFDTDPAHMSQITERLDRFHDLSRKHRVAPGCLAEHAQGLASELEAQATERQNVEALQQEACQWNDEFQRTAERVSSARREAAEAFANEVSAHVQALGMAGGAFAVAFDAANSERGLETVEFQVTTNPKYPAGSLARIASGGERARLSLAVSVVAAQKMRLPCLVLDEADVGVGGTTADIVGRLLRDLGNRTQVICVTHAPQVAALGNSHLVVEKDAAQNVALRCVTADHRTEEVARMLAGADLTDKTRAYARTLLEEAGAA
ncbi:MAG: DNA repair protein RecN [Gammaproteobacteria bacterium]|nr:DNA repair protein RecN [Gammaproteobacteria bacterium]